MRVILTVTDGPNAGKAFTFAERDYFIVGRGAGVHFQPDKQDRFFSRFHFMVEVNPPLCRLVDLGSRNGTRINGEKGPSAELKDGDSIRAGHTALSVTIEHDADPPTGSWLPEPSTGTLPALMPADIEATPAIPGYRIVREL